MNYRPTLLTLLLLMICTIVVQAQRSVKTKDAVPINGISQWIVADGKDDTKPVLLFLHGGPGFPSRPYAKNFVKLLRRDFIVVQWDQRASGLTQHFSPNTDPLTLELFHQDTYEVIEYLRKRFSQDKIFLVGFSWGGFLGWRYAHDHPEKLRAYISVSSMIHNNESEQRTLSILRDKARDNPVALEDLSQINIPFTSWEELYFQRKWTSAIINNRPYKGEAMRPIFEKWSQTWFSLFQQASAVNYSEAAPDLACPVYFLQSKQDYVSNHTVSEAYFKALQAPSKAMIWFYESSHEIPNDEPKKFSEELIKIGQIHKR